MEEKKHIRSKNIIQFIIIIVIIIVGANIISRYNFNDFEKAVKRKGVTDFSRDLNIKYSDMNSYKIKNREYADAIFYKNIEIKPNTPYRVTCMVKTENVQNENNILTGGAQISIKGTTECSESVTGTNDWTKLTLMFNSKNRENVEIGFRLGGYEENSIGTAWFSDFKIEEGELDTNNEWKIVCFLIENLDIDQPINGKQTHIKLSMTDEDIKDMQNNMDRLPNVLKELSNGQMTATCETINIKEPLKTISYDEENEYYIDPKDVKPLINEYLKNNEYDYIYVAARFGNTNVKNVLAHDWIGLGGMDYYGIGFSNIRLPDQQEGHVYRYSTFNTFPEEVFVHEFLHTLERNEKEYNNPNITELHGYSKYGYMTDPIEGLKKWYIAYMQNKVTNSEGNSVGLTTNIYTSKPIHESNFTYSYELNSLQEPQNILEEISSIMNKVIKLFQGNTV